MPFSFIEIESRKSRVITFAFSFIILVYFLTAYLLLLLLNNLDVLFFYESIRRPFSWPGFGQVLIAASVAFLAAFIHWTFSTNNLIPRLSKAIGSCPIDPQDTYHQYFKRIVEEVSVAIGGRKIEPMIISSFGMNAFSLVDFEDRAVIGITEGLLARLSRSQIEAVVAHEAAHIANGDCLPATVMCSLSEIYEESLCRIKSVLEQVKGRGSLIIVLIYAILAVTGFLSKLLRCFLSREREFRADAVGVRLCRDPLSLAEALKLISGNWHGEGSEGENIQSIFIVNPKFDELDEKEGFLSDMFSTHPPVKKRLDVLLSLAHLDENTLEQNLKDFKRVSPVAKPEVSVDEPADLEKWLVLDEGKWVGPLSLDDLRSMPKLYPMQWVRPEEGGKVIMACDEPKIKELFKSDHGDFSCPKCKTALQQINYEGAPVFKCRYCEGVLAENNKIPRILIRQDYVPSQEIVRLGKLAAASKDKFKINQPNPNLTWVIDCPKCKSKMHRQFFNYSYPVEVDSCSNCQETWFDKDELEVLQYIYENKEEILY